MSCAQAHWIGSKLIRKVMQLKLHKSTMAIGYLLRMCARQVDSTNPEFKCSIELKLASVIISMRCKQINLRRTKPFHGTRRTKRCNYLAQAIV